MLYLCEKKISLYFPPTQIQRKGVLFFGGMYLHKGVSQKIASTGADVLCKYPIDGGALPGPGGEVTPAVWCGEVDQRLLKALRLRRPSMHTVHGFSKGLRLRHGLYCGGVLKQE